jgi:predicted transcriptional regulator
VVKSLKTTIVLNAVSDDASLELFKLVALTNGTSELLRSRMGITRKQYYPRLYNLIQCGLIKRKDRKYFLTALGRVMYDSQITIENAIRDYWKIKAMDSFRITRDIPWGEQKKIIETVIQDPGIKNALIQES